MAGSKTGGELAAITNKRKYGENFYRQIGSKGGKVVRPETRPFAVDRQLAREAGAVGGRKSRRNKRGV